MNNKKIAGTAILIALTVILTLISNFISFAGVSINLSLIPIAIAGILYGPVAALFVGIINGVVILFAPSTEIFFNMTIIGTIITCLVKGGLSGLISAFAYKLIKKEKIAIIISSLLLPILNTFIFVLCSLIFFNNDFKNVISLFVSVNFLIEFASTIIFTPVIIKIVNIEKAKK